MIRVFLADDESPARERLKELLQDIAAEVPTAVAGEARNGVEALERLPASGAQVLLLDIRMPGMDGLTVLERLRERYPKVRVAILSAVDDPAVIQAAFNRGASAFIVKHIDPRDLPAAIRQAIAGAIFQPLGLLERDADTAAREADLSKRELTILHALQSGQSNKQIAGELFLAEQTVKFHLTNIYRKLGVSSRTEAVRYAFEHGLADGATYAVA